jgi:putative membrane protein
MDRNLLDRRAMFLAAAAAATAGPAFAQTKPAPNTASGTGQLSLSEAEQTHANQTAMLGGASLQMANIALQKARHPRLKEFAKFEHDEQTTVAEVLKSMDPNLQPPPPPQDVAATIDRLQHMSPGLAFDREFVSAQIQGHEKLRGVQQDYLKAGKDLPTINVSKLTLGMINEHLALLSDLRHDRLASL